MDLILSLALGERMSFHLVFSEQVWGALHSTLGGGAKRGV